MRMSAFLATTLLGEVGERRDEPKAEQKIVLRSRVLRNNCLEGLFHTVPSSFVLHCSLHDSRMETTALLQKKKKNKTKQIKKQFSLEFIV